MTGFPADITIPQLAAIAVGLVGSVTDVRTAKIYNWLTFPAALVGIVMSAVLGAMAAPDAPFAAGLAGMAQAVGAWFLGVGIMLGLKFGLRLSQTGFGDVKLLAALGTFIGPPLVFATFFYYCVVYSFWTCAIMVLALPWKQFALAYASKNAAVLNWEHFNEVRKKPIAMGPFITAGLVIAILFQVPTLQFMGIGH